MELLNAGSSILEEINSLISGTGGNIFSLIVSIITIVLCFIFIKRVLIKGIIIGFTVCIIIGCITGSFNLFTVIPTAITILKEFYWAIKAFIGWIVGLVI